MNHLAQFGTVDPPAPVSQFGGGALEGIPIFLSIILKTLIMGASLFALVNFVLAGYAYMSAGGDSKKIQDATSKITMTIVGLVVVASSFTIAAVIGKLLFGDYNALLQVKIFTPN
jgi:hypothetical protein